MTAKAGISVWKLFSLSYIKPLLLSALKYVKYMCGKSDWKCIFNLDFDKWEIAISFEQLQIISLRMYSDESLQVFWKIVKIPKIFPCSKTFC